MENENNVANDQNQNNSASNEQQNNSENGNGNEQNTSNDIEVSGVKLSLDALKKHEKLKDYFDAYENRENWQRENTRRAQEIADIKRKAEAFDRLQSDSRNKPPQNEFEAQKQAYLERKRKAGYTDQDMKFWGEQFDDLWELSGRRSQESLTPILQQQSEQWEEKFLASHPLVKKDTDQYYKIGDLIEKGYDPEDAYQKVFSKELMDSEFENRLKKRDEEAKRKLQSSRTASSNGSPAKGKNFSDRAWDIINKMSN